MQERSRCGNVLLRLRAAAVGVAVQALVAGLALVPAPARAYSLEGPNDLIQTALTAYRDGQLDEAARQLDRAIAMQPRSVAAQYLLAKTHLLASRIYPAFYALREVLALAPEHVKGKRLMQELTGRLLSQVKADIAARRHLPTAYNVLGFLLISQGRLDEGIRRQEYALQVDPKLAVAYDDLAWAAYKQRDLKRAFEMASRAFDMDPVKGSIAAHYEQLFNLERLGVTRSEAVRQAAAIREPPLGTGEGALGDESSHGAVLIASDAAPASSSDGGSSRVSLEGDLERALDGDVQLVSNYLDQTRLAGAATQVLPEAGNAAAPALHQGPLRLAQAPVGRGAPAHLPPRPSAPPVRPVNPLPVAAVDEATRQALIGTYERARAAEDARDWSLALKFYDTVLATDRNFKDVNTRMLDIRRAQEAAAAYDDAVTCLRDQLYTSALALLRDIDRKALFRAKGIDQVENLVGEAAFGARQFDAAKDALGRWLEAHPEDSDTRMVLVKVLQTTGDFSGALDQVRRISSKDPEYMAKNPDLYSLQMKLWVKSYFTIVVVLAALWFSMASAFVYARVQRGSHKRQVRGAIERLQAALKKERWEEVLDSADKAGSLALGRAEEVFVGCSSGLAALYLGDVGRADKVQKQLMAVHPEDPQVHHLRARILLAQKDFSVAAVEEYHKLLAVEPNNRTLLETLNTYYQNHRPDSDEAAKILERLLELDPTNPQFRYYRALKCLRSKDHSESARLSYVRVLEVEPDRHEIRAALSRCHFENRQYLEAIQAAKKVLETDLHNQELHRILVTSYMKLSMQQEAIKEYRNLVARYPQIPQLRQVLDQIENFKTTDLDEMQESREAVSLYEKGVRLFQESQYSEAIGPLTAAFNTAALRLPAGALLVRCYLKNRETRMALSIFEKMDAAGQKKPEEYLLGLCYDLAELYTRENKPDRALELYTYICKYNVSYRDAFAKMEVLQEKKNRGR